MEYEFLTESTQKLRKSLLIASLIGYAISKAGLSVTKVSLLGSELSISRFEVIPFVLGIVVLYFLVTFIVFGLYEYNQRNIKSYSDTLEKIAKDRIPSVIEAKKRIEELEGELDGLKRESAFTSIHSPERGDKLRDRIREIEKEIATLQGIVSFYDRHETSIHKTIGFDIKIGIVRKLFDLYFPILVGLYVAILLFIFTKIPKVNAATLKPTRTVDIGLRLSLDDANNVTSYLLIDKPISDEGD